MHVLPERATSPQGADSLVDVCNKLRHKKSGVDYAEVGRRWARQRRPAQAAPSVAPQPGRAAPAQRRSGDASNAPSSRLQAKMETPGRPDEAKWVEYFRWGGLAVARQPCTRARQLQTLTCRPGSWACAAGAALDPWR
jgi:hypothetical protein